MNVDRQRKEGLMQLRVLPARGHWPSGSIDRSLSPSLIATSVSRQTPQNRSDRSDGGLAMQRLIASIAALLVLLMSGLGTAIAQDASPAASPVASLVGTEPLPLTGARLAEFETYVADMMTKANVPGASIAVVQGGEVVYARRFGVRDLGGTEPVTPDTLMLVGSTQKSMTSLLAATLVDAGEVRWDTPVD